MAGNIDSPSSSSPSSSSSHQGSVSFNHDDIEDFASRTKIIKIVQCTVCSEIPIQPIYSCQQGHVICIKCRSRIRLCRVCASEMSDTRNLTAEALVGSFVFKCKNRGEGCLESVPWKDVLQHLKRTCHFRPIRCTEGLYRSCRGAVIPYSSYVSHLKNHHHIRVFRTQDKIARSVTCDKLSNDCVWPLFTIGFDNQVFFQNIRIENQCAYIWLSHFGPPEEDARYLAEISLQKETHGRHRPREEVMNISARLPVQNFRVTFDEMKAGGMLLSIEKATLMAMSVNDFRNPDDNNVYKFSWTVLTKMFKM